MPSNLRQSEILRLISGTGKVQVDALAEHFSISTQTIRKDLAELADQGHLKRVHGGAILRAGATNIAYLDRQRLNGDVKLRIAEACAADIPNNASVFLSIGTTTEAVARALSSHRDLMVITNNLNIANILADHPSCEVLVTGGKLRRSDGGLTGAQAVKFIQQFKVDHAIVGCSALDSDGDLLDFDVEEVSVAQAVLGQARHASLVADSSKFGRAAPVRIGSMAQLDVVYTDSPVPDTVQDLCDGWSTQIVLGSLRRAEEHIA